MLRTLHRYRIAFLVFLAASSVALAFSGFAYQLFSPRQKNAAIKIDDQELSFQDIDNERRELDRMYRARLGFGYHRLLESMGVNLQQQTVDRLIQNTLMEREASKIGFGVSKQQVAEELERQLAGSPNPQEQYRMLLRDIGMTPGEFEGRMQLDLLRAQIEQVARDSSIASDREVEAALTRQRAKLDVAYVEVKSSDLLSQTGEPTPEALKKYYDDNASDFELPARASYKFAVLAPENFLDLVEVSPDDVEIYYTDHESEYSTPELRKVRVIELSDTSAKSNKKSDKKSIKKEEPGKKEEVASDRSKLSAEILEKLKNGASFEDLAKQHPRAEAASQGSLTAALSQDELGKNFSSAAATAVFALEQGKTSEAITEGSKTWIFKVEGITPSGARSLDSVRPEIEAKIRQREAPAFLSAKASELLEDWQKANIPLQDFITNHPVNGSSLANRKIAVGETDGLLDKDHDPAGLKGLSERVIEAASEHQQLIDLGDKLALVEVRESKEPEVQSFETVKTKVSALVKSHDANQAAKTLAQTLVDETKSGKYKSFEMAALAAGLKVQTAKSISRESPPAPFSDGELRSALFTGSEAGAAPQKVFSKNGSFFVFQITKVETPSKDEILKDLAKSREQTNQLLAQTLLGSMVSKLKAQSKIDIQPGVLSDKF